MEQEIDYQICVKTTITLVYIQSSLGPGNLQVNSKCLNLKVYL